MLLMLRVIIGNYVGLTIEDISQFLSRCQKINPFIGIDDNGFSIKDLEVLTAITGIQLLG